MKTIHYVIAVIMLSVTLSRGAVSVPNQVEPGNLNTVMGGGLVKAMIIDGQIIPVVDLPEIEVTARDIKKVSGIPAGNNSPVKTVDLREIEVVAGKEIPNRYGAIVRDGELVAIIDLPAIEVIAPAVSEVELSRVTWKFSPIECPEKSYLVRANLVNNTILPLVDLPEIEIISDVPQPRYELNRQLIAHQSNDWFLMTLRNYGVEINGLNVCQVMMR